MHPCQRGAESLGLPGSLFTNLYSQSGCAVRASPVTPVGLLRVLPLQAVAMQGAGQRERRQDVAACSLAEQLGPKATKGVAHCLLKIQPTSYLRAVYFCQRSKLRKIFSGTSCQCKVDSEPHRLRSNFLSWPNPAFDLGANLHHLFQQVHTTVVSLLSTLACEPPRTDVCGANSAVLTLRWPM